MIQILAGTIQTLFVEKRKQTKYILSAQNEMIELSFKNTKADLDVGDYIKVFLFVNDRGNVEATTYLPHFEKDEYGWATVIKVVPHLGVFVSIGTNVDVLVPKDYLPSFRTVWPQIDDQLYVYLTLDRQNRLLATIASEQAIEPLFEIAHSDDIKLNDSVEGRIFFTSKEGSTMLTSENYRGFIHRTEREKEPRLGQHVTGRVIDIKDDGTINVSLKPLKHERIDDDAKMIYEYLQKQGGKMTLNDHSHPEEIKEIFNLSKSAFKRALGRLMRDRKVNQNAHGTFITDEVDDS